MLWLHSGDDFTQRSVLLNRRVSLRPLLVLSLMQWRQSANDRCSGSEQAACAVERSLPHAICSYPSPGRTCQRRPASIETFLSSLSWLCPPLCLFTVQSGAWHWSPLAAGPASVQCMGGKKAHSESQEAQHTLSAFVICVRPVVFQLWTRRMGPGPEDAELQRYDS